MKVVVLGATGRTGRRVVKRALDDGHQVTGIARTPSKLDLTHDSLDVKQGDTLDYDSFAGLLDGQDAVISTIGKESYLSRVTLYSESITNIVRAMKDHGVFRLIAISSGGTYPRWDQNNAIFYEVLIKRILLRGEYQDMRRMESIIQDSDLAWTIVRPSGLSDDEGSGNYRTKVGYSFAERSTTTRDDLAEFIVDELTADQFVQDGVAVVSE